MRPVNRNTRSGYGRVIEKSQVAKTQEKITQKLNEREEHVKNLVEKYKNVEGLAFKGGKLEEMMEKDSVKTGDMLIFLENTQKKAFTNPILVQNALQEQNLQNLSERQIKEAVQVGGAMNLMLPSDIVKVSRIGYSNSVAREIFDVFAMQSVKDSIYKLETTYGSDERGVTKGEVDYETYGEGRYPTTMEKETGFVASNTNKTWTLTETDNGHLIPFKVAIFVDGEQIAIDDGNGKLVGGALDNTATNTVNYTTGATTFTLSTAISSTADVEIEYIYDFEDETLFDHTGSVLLNLVEYGFSAVLNPLAIEWTNYAETVMGSKLGLSAKDMLVKGAGDMFRKSFDERLVRKGILASNWSSAVEFNSDFAVAGSDSSMNHAQSILQAIKNAEGKTYNELGRFANSSKLICDINTATYLSKHKRYESVKPTSKVGIFQTGSIDEYDIYIAPKDMITGADANTGMIYVMGKADENLSVDSPVSCGIFGSTIMTNPVELKNFNSQAGMGIYSDTKTLNKKFATKVKVTNLNNA